MISSLCNLIKRYWYGVDRPSWVLVIILIAEKSHCCRRVLMLRQPSDESDAQECSRVIVTIHGWW